MLTERLTEDDLFVDLGCGDGRVALSVARRFGCRAIGVELNKALVRLANQKRRKSERQRVSFVHGDIADARLKDATVVYLYMTSPAVHHIVEHVLPGSTFVWTFLTLSPSSRVLPYVIMFLICSFFQLSLALRTEVIIGVFW